MMISVEEAKKILGKRAGGLNDRQVESVIAQFQCLADGWLDSFERGVFKGKTVNELLTGKGGLN